MAPSSRSVARESLKGIKKAVLILGLLYLALFFIQRFLPHSDYREAPLVGSRVLIWVIAQLHLMLAAFVLGVPIFAVIAEIIGARTGQEKYDHLAREFTKLLFLAFTTTAVMGCGLLLVLAFHYSKLFHYMRGVFSPVWSVYIALIFAEVAFLYAYWYSWEPLRRNKNLHIGIGIMLNLCGTGLLFLADSWVAFMTTPSGVDPTGRLLSLRQAMTTFLWMPLNIHRLIANVSFGGAVVAAYAAYRFLRAGNEEEKAHYDWMGYTGNFIALSALILLPFAGYWLGREIYHFSSQMGVEMMGGAFSWLWILQAVLIGAIFLGANFYLWIGMQRIPGSERYGKFVFYLLTVLTVCWMIWATPHNLPATSEEMRKMGGAVHPFLGVLGLMSAKNTVVNLMILATFLNFMLYRRANKAPTAPWAPVGQALQAIILAASTAVVIGYGIYGYYDFFGFFGPSGGQTPPHIRVGFSAYQILIVLFTVILCTALDLAIFRNARTLGEIRWGKLAPRSQYVLFFLAVSYTWLMGLMGYVRSALRQHWHIWGIMKDTSPGAFTPTVGHATLVVSGCTVCFLALVGFIIWMGERGEPDATERVPPGGSGE
ncbi:MAG: cytochrome ubiquinol oxidase subunit I [Armatimonadetes bacterium]|nr:cytochrome ubiquinol oxidase subunit I [Armatimonadota bacterium]